MSKLLVFGIFMLTVVGVLAYVLYQQKKLADKIEKQSENVSAAVASAMPMFVEQQRQYLEQHQAISGASSMSHEEISHAASVSLAEAVVNDEFINALRFRIYEMEQADILHPRDAGGSVEEPNIVEISTDEDVPTGRNSTANAAAAAASVAEATVEEEPEVSVEDLDLEQLSSLMDAVTTKMHSTADLAAIDESDDDEKPLLLAQ